MDKLAPALLALSVAAVLGCGNMVKVTRVENGRKITTWTTPEEAERMKQADQKKADMVEAYRKAEKRKPTDPITVALYEATISADLEKAIKKDRLQEQIRQHFQNDPLIRIVDQKAVGASMATRSLLNPDSAPTVNADVVVTPHVMTKDQVGINRASGKVGMTKALVFKATVASTYLPEDRHEVEKMGHVLQNVQTTKEFAEAIKHAIKEKIGPNIPSKAALAKIRGGGAEELDLGKVGDWLRSLRKKE